MFHALPEDLVSDQLFAFVKFVPDTENITETVLGFLLNRALSGEVHNKGPVVTLTQVLVQRDILYTVHSLTLEIILPMIITIVSRVLTVAKITNTRETCQH